MADVVYITGDSSGVGKTSFCIGLLNACLLEYEPSDIAYIKPCTQCEDVQLLWKWCTVRDTLLSFYTLYLMLLITHPFTLFPQSVGIEYVGVGPILYRPGYTQEVIDGKHGTAESRLASVEEAVSRLRVNRKIVIVDGVGYAAVGSCIGVSNADVAARLRAPVIVVGRPGVGNAIDSLVSTSEFMSHRGARVIGAVFNKIPRKVTYHSFDKCVEYVTRFLDTYKCSVAEIDSNGNRLPAKDGVIVPYGFVPVLVDKDGNELGDGKSYHPIIYIFTGIVCIFVCSLVVWLIQLMLSRYRRRMCNLLLSTDPIRCVVGDGRRRASTCHDAMSRNEQTC
jgi:dethiobiotin synthetase